jgi:hypothetical protein
MGDDELMEAIAENVGAQKVPPGLVRRKRAHPPVLAPDGSLSPGKPTAKEVPVPA